MYKRVLVALDGSSTAEAILPFITQIAGPLDIGVVLLRVVEPIRPVVIEGTRHVVVEDHEARRRDAKEYLAPIAVRLTPVYTDVEGPWTATDMVVVLARRLHDEANLAWRRRWSTRAQI